MVLKPSLDACLQISRMAGNSLELAIQRCARMDFEFICEIIALGLDATSPALKKEVREKVYLTGVINIAADCILFVRTIMNGGVLPKDEDEGGGDDDSERPLATTESSSESTTAD